MSASIKRTRSVEGSTGRRTSSLSSSSMLAVDYNSGDGLSFSLYLILSHILDPTSRSSVSAWITLRKYSRDLNHILSLKGKKIVTTILSLDNKRRR
jgi:hypothetical protein